MRVLAIVLVVLSILPPATAGAQGTPALVKFMGHSFYICRSDIVGFLGIAFDPLENRVVSQGIFDVCGTLVDANYDSDSGMAWDPVNEEVWKINTATRDVYRTVGGTNELIFNIPLTFDVPGVGPDTLEAPQGLAIDGQHVYVVDSGPNLGQIESNAWFKFTRDGTPVSSSKATDFVTGIVAPADDAVVDGITWCPPSSPFAPGLFLVAIEHTGILVIDENGFVVDDIVWAEDGLVYGESVPSAFAGITIDPTTGDLYLAENDGGGDCHVWVHVPEETSVYLGSNSAVHFPDTRCPRQLLHSAPSSGLVFGLELRPEDGTVWGTEFNTGEIYRINPRSGTAVEVIPNGGWPVSIWGMTYDQERDSFYLYRFDDLVYVIEDPSAPSVVPLPDPVGADFAGTDIAFNRDDGFIYTVTSFGGVNPTLVRIDRDTGTGVAVGPTQYVSGLTYDPRIGQLVGVANGSSNNDLYTIDPATGAATLLASSATEFFGWEGLTVLNPPSSIVSAPEEVPSATSRVALHVRPSPFASRAWIVVDRPASMILGIAIYDVTGRRIRSWSSADVSRLGTSAVSWDGRTDRGVAVPAGVYYVRMRTSGGDALTAKALRVR